MYKPYRPIVRLNTDICKVCNKLFKNEKSLKDHIFSRWFNDRGHTAYKNEIRYLRFKNAKLKCIVCNQKIFRNMRTHFNRCGDKPHKEFLEEQSKYLLERYLSGYHCSDILKVRNKYVAGFSYKYISRTIIDLIGNSQFEKISKTIRSKKRMDYWKRFTPGERKSMMKLVYESQWKNLTPSERKNHPWVIAGRIASLKSSKKGSKNQKYAFNLLKLMFPKIRWKYNYVIKDGWHVDIVAPEKLLFIEWDGRHHFIPIHGLSTLKNRINRDRVKNKIITKEIGGCIIRIKDEGRANKQFVEKKVHQISKIIKSTIPKEKLIQL